MACGIRDESLAEGMAHRFARSVFVGMSLCLICMNLNETRSLYASSMLKLANNDAFRVKMR